MDPLEMLFDLATAAEDIERVRRGHAEKFLAKYGAELGINVPQSCCCEDTLCYEFYAFEEKNSLREALEAQMSI